MLIVAKEGIVGPVPMQEGPDGPQLAWGAGYVVLANDGDAYGLAADLSRIDTIVLHFPKYRDGRAYSQAVVLRRDLGFQGHLIATGQVMVDQVELMRDAGIDQFVVPDTATANAIMARLNGPRFAHWRGRPHAIVRA